MSANEEPIETSSPDTQPSLRSGAEPTELLLALASSPIVTLCQRNDASGFQAVGNDGRSVVIIVFANSSWDPEKGIVLAKTEALAEEEG
jgi:hypothetical protein